MTQTATKPVKTATLAALKSAKKKGGLITLPTGNVVRIEIPSLPELLRQNQVPNELVKYATDEADNVLAGSVDMAKIKEATDFMRFIVAATVVDPDLQPDEVPELAVEDSDMIMEFALRQREVDAVGHQLHGLEQLSEWRQFRYGPRS